MSTFRFCRHFKKATGFPFREFLVRRRVARALRLLRDRNRSVRQVFQEVGFKDLVHLSRTFRKLTGQPPSRYRRVGGDRAGGGKARVARTSVPPGLPRRPSRRPSAAPTGKKSNDRQIISKQSQAGSTSGAMLNLGGEDK